MVEKIKCDHCGAEAFAKYVITKEFNGKMLNFCCRGCLQVYELLLSETTEESVDQNTNE